MEDEANKRLVLFTKTVKMADGRQATGRYWFNPALQVKGIEPCFVLLDGVKTECTKIIYPRDYVTLIGSESFFLDTLKNSNITICLLNELFESGFTIKQFMEQAGKINDVNLM